MTEITKVRVISAVTLRESQILDLKQLMRKKLGKEVEILAEIDTSLIGGLYIQFDGMVLDNTIKKQLRELKESIKRRGAL